MRSGGGFMEQAERFSRWARRSWRPGARRAGAWALLAAAGVAAIGVASDHGGLSSLPITAPSANRGTASTIDAHPFAGTAIGSTPDAAMSSLDINGVSDSRIDHWVSKLTTSLKDEFQVALGRMDHYDDMIDAKLAERQMPRELIYLAMIESEFNPNARSHAQAVGMWQFMKG